MTADETPTIQTKPYERQENEPLKHFEWFHAFLMLGPSRSLLGAYNLFHKQRTEKSGKVWSNKLDASNSWKDTQHAWKWKERAAAWDAEQRKKTEAEYEERRKKLNDGCFEAREMALEKMQTMLRFPVIKTKITNGETTIEPAKWTFDTVPRLMAMIEDEDKTIHVKHEFDELSDDELIRRAAQLTSTIAQAIASLASGNGAAGNDPTDKL